MICGGNATVFVSDMDRAVKFYTESLGLKLEFRAGNEWASIDAGVGLKIGLHEQGAHTTKAGTKGSIEIGLIINEPIDKAVQHFKSQGVVFNGPVIDDEMVKIAFFGDPDGNALYLCQVMQ